MKKRKTMAKRKTIVLTLAWVAFLLLLGIVGGVEKNWIPLSALWWAVPCLMVWAGGLWKGGWIRV